MIDALYYPLLLGIAAVVSTVWTFVATEKTDEWSDRLKQMDWDLANQEAQENQARKSAEAFKAAKEMQEASKKKPPKYLEAYKDWAMVELAHMSETDREAIEEAASLIQDFSKLKQIPGVSYQVHGKKYKLEEFQALTAYYIDYVKLGDKGIPVLTAGPLYTGDMTDEPRME